MLNNLRRRSREEPAEKEAHTDRESTGSEGQRADTARRRQGSWQTPSEEQKRENLYKEEVVEGGGRKRRVR